MNVATSDERVMWSRRLPTPHRIELRDATRVRALVDHPKRVFAKTP